LPTWPWGAPPGSAHPPLTYLTRWRMTLAADLLAEREAATVAAIARALGYSDPFAFSAAFKRIRGVSPSEFRRSGTVVPERPADPPPRPPGAMLPVIPAPPPVVRVRS
ncbi:helix-turn-helix domain-containing protein, partial [Streptomyces scopuliridis]|uniref:helix-turn-helix domain-containing protein n=1 Tax=Streptomyces scopuliridis TaxID=452529 RepID=UPI0036B3A70B